MAANWHDTPERPAGSPLSGDIGARVAAIVHAAEREAQAAERAIADHRRAAEEEIQRYLAAARLRVDVEAAARAARLEALGAATRRLAAELSDATSALSHELNRADDMAATGLPHTPWPAPTRAPAPAEPAAPAPAAAAAPAPPKTEPTWTRSDSAASTDESAVPADWTLDPATSSPETLHVPHDPLTPAEPADDPTPAAHTATGTSPGAEVPSAARLVAIEMAVSGSSRADVEQHLREQLGATDAHELLDDVFGPASHAGSTLAWGQP